MSDKKDLVLVVDDNPEIWDAKTHKNCLVIEVEPFTGEVGDDKLMTIRI